MKSISLHIIILAILISLGSFVEDDPIADLTEKFTAHSDLFAQHKLLVSFNQPTYAPGDTAYFKAHLLTEDLKPVSGRQVIHMVWVDAMGSEVIREAFTIDNGITGNQTIVPNDLPAGIYQLVAYTNWMRNFSPSMYFTTPFNVSGENYFIPQFTEPVKIELFAEGGNMVAGVPMKVVAAASRNGMPVAAEGRIVDSNGNEVKRFVCDKTGLASFDIEFKNNAQYALEELPAGIKVPIDINQEGYTLRLTREGEILKTSIQYKARRQDREGVYLVATSRSKIRYASVINVNSNEPSTVVIPLKNIPEGVVQVFLFDSKLNELASRLLFIAGQTEPTIDFRSKSAGIATRNEIPFEIEIKEQNDQVKPLLLVNGHYDNLFSAFPTKNFREQLLVACDVPDSQYLLDLIDLGNADDQLVLDQYLITKKWERFNWEDIVSNKRKIPAFSREDILIHQGVATYSATGKPVPDSTQISFFLQKNIFGYEVYTTDNGKFIWPIYFDFYGDETVMYSLEHRNKSLPNVSVRFVRDSLTGFKAPMVQASEKKDLYYSFNTLTRVVNTSFSYAWKKEETQIANPNPNAAIEDELNGADFKINVEDYVVFPTIEDLFREVVRFVQNRKVGGKATLRVLSTDSNKPITGDPLYVVDGIATKNTDFILNLKPGDIAVIKVINDVKKLRYLGGISKNGVIFFQTKVANMGTLIARNDILDVRGLNKPIPYSSMMKSMQQQRTPNLRSSIYWNAQPELNELGLFNGVMHAADNTGPLKIRVQGIIDGIPFDREEIVNVNFAASND